MAVLQRAPRGRQALRGDLAAPWPRSPRPVRLRLVGHNER